MPTYKNPTNARIVATPEGATDLAVNPQVFDFANTAYRPSSLVNTDKIEVGVVPAGYVLVEHLSAIRIPQIDSNGTPTGQASIGTAAVPAALRAAGVVNAALTLTGEDFTLTNGPIGSRTADTPIYLTFTANVATTVTTGKIRADLAIRPWNAAIDGT